MSLQIENNELRSQLSTPNKDMQSLKNENVNMQKHITRALIYWGTKVWNIDINFVVIKKQIKNKYKNICLVKFEVLGYENTKK